MLLAGLGACGFIALALGSWHSTDTSFSVVGHGPARNVVGSLGAVIADLLLQGFGYASWAVVGVAAMIALRLAGRRVGGWMSSLLGGFAFVSLAIGVELVVGVPGTAFPAGGLVGALGVRFLVPELGRAGTGIGVGVALVTSLTVLFKINWQPMFARAVERVQTGVPAAARAVGSFGGAAVRAGASGVGAMRDRLRPVPQDEDEEADGGDEDERDDVASELEAPPRLTATPPRLTTTTSQPVRLTNTDRPRLTEDRPRLPEPARPRQPPVRSERPSLPDVPSVDLPAPPSVWASRAVPDLLPIDDIDRDAPTQHSARELVEVEWERTQNPSRATVTGGDAGSRPSPTRPEPASRAEPPARPSLSAPPRAADPPSRFDAGLSAYASGDRASVSARPSVAAPPSPRAAAAETARAPVAALPSDPADLPSPAALPVAQPRRQGASLAPLAPTVSPGNLRSGGVNDDGRAVRVPVAAQRPYELPPLSLLDHHPEIVTATDEAVLHELAHTLTAKLLDFGVEGRVTAIRPGPVITMFEYEPSPGVKLSKIESLEDDLAMALKAMSVRIIAPIPGRGVVGVEIPNEKRQTVWSRDCFSSKEFRDPTRALPVVLGKDTEGRPYVADLQQMPHLLVGGTTGAGKSVGVNAMLCSLLLTRTPEELRFILVDPKMLEFEMYKDIPHLLHPVVTEAKLASAVLKWACVEMDERYELLARWQTRNIEGYNQRVEEESKDWTPEKARKFAPKDWPEGDLLPAPRKLAYIVIVIDELSDLMMVAKKDVEVSIARVAQKARASGIHLIVATQRPSVDVITGLIKANLPSRLAYQVRQVNDGRTILDQKGAETLLGKGDLLFLGRTGGLVRCHAPFLTDNEVRRITDHCRAQGAPEYAPPIRMDEGEGMSDDDLAAEKDEKYDRALDFAIEKGRISTSMIQRHLGVGYNKAAKIMEIMEQEGVVGPADGAKAREVLIQAR